MNWLGRFAHGCLVAATVLVAASALTGLIWVLDDTFGMNATLAILAVSIVIGFGLMSAFLG